MRRSVLAGIAIALLAPVASAQLYTIDTYVEIPADGAPVITGAPIVKGVNATEGESVELRFALTKPYTVLEVRMHRGAFDVERREQVVPTWIEPGVDYPLFELFPNAELWTAEGPARVYRYFDEGDERVLRVGLVGPGTTARAVNGTLAWSPDRIEAAPGATVIVNRVGNAAHTFTMEGFDAEVGDGLRVRAPTEVGEHPFHCRYHENMTGVLVVTESPNATLRLERDVTPPTVRFGGIRERTPYSFYQETTTDELAIVDMQRRAKGTEEWVQNPTTVYHVLQKFPIQGLDPDTEYEVRTLAHDWAGNTATSEIYTVRTPKLPDAPEPTITPLEPMPNATVKQVGVTVRARIASPDSPVLRDNVRLIFDLREVTPDIEISGGEVVYFPPVPLSVGSHRVRIEVTNNAGGEAVADWRFTVQGEEKARTPGPALPTLAFVMVALALALRRR